MDEDVRNPSVGVVAAIVAFALALLSAFVFLSHVLIFVFPIMPLGVWLGWHGRNSKLQVFAWVGFGVCLGLTVVSTYVFVRYLAG